MKFRVLGACLVAFLCAAPSGANAAEMKIAVLDAQAAVMNSSAFKATSDAFTQQFTTEINQIKSLQAEIKALEERAGRDGSVMSDDDKRKLASDIRDKQNNLQFLGNKLQSAQNDKMQEVLQRLAPQLETIVKAIVDAESIDLVLNRQAVMFTKPDLDLTRRVTEKLNETRAQ